MDTEKSSVHSENEKLLREMRDRLVEIRNLLAEGQERYAADRVQYQRQQREWLSTYRRTTFLAFIVLGLVVALLVYYTLR